MSKIIKEIVKGDRDNKNTLSWVSDNFTYHRLYVEKCEKSWVEAKKGQFGVNHVNIS